MTKVSKWPVGFVIACGTVVLAARYGVFTKLDGCVTAVVCALILITGWLAPVQFVRD